MSKTISIGSPLIFDFVWASPDELSKTIKPLRYGRVEIDYGAPRIAEGAIVEVGDFRDPQTMKLVEDVWVLRIAVGVPDAQPLERYIESGKQPAVRVCS